MELAAQVSQFPTISGWTSPPNMERPTENYHDFDELITNPAPNLWFAPLVSEAADCAMIFGLVADLRTYDMT